MKLIFKLVSRICMNCKKEYTSNDGCVLCPECVEHKKQINKLLGN